MLAIIPALVLFYLRYVSYVSFYFRFCISVRTGIRLTPYDSLLSLQHTIRFNWFCMQRWSLSITRCLHRSQKLVAYAFIPCVALQDNVQKKGNRNNHHITIMITTTMTLKNCFANQNSYTTVKLSPKCQSTSKPPEIVTWHVTWHVT